MTGLGWQVSGSTKTFTVRVVQLVDPSGQVGRKIFSGVTRILICEGSCVGSVHSSPGIGISAVPPALPPVLLPPPVPPVPTTGELLQLALSAPNPRPAPRARRAHELRKKGVRMARQHTGRPRMPKTGNFSPDRAASCR
ncbi:MAG: hypothetical protein QM820_36225 [Minicystis sp.]